MAYNIFEMEPFELNVIAEKKLVTITGFINESEQFYVNFLREFERPKETKLQCLKQLLKYQGSEFIINIASTLLFIIGQVIILIAYSNDRFVQLLAIFCLAYVLIFNTLINRKYEVLYQVLALMVAISVIVVLYAMSIYTNMHILIGGAAILLLSLLRKVFIQIQRRYLQSTCYTGFSCQNNLIVFSYVIWKAYLLALQKYALFNLNYASLLVSFFALNCIALIKIYSLFNYDILNVIHIFQAKNGEKLQNKNQATGLNKIINIKLNDNRENGNQDSGQGMIPQILANKEGLGEKSQHEQDKDRETSKDNLQAHTHNISMKSHESKRRIITTVVFGIFFICQIVFHFINGDTNENIKQLFIFTSKFTLILILCQTQKVIQNMKNNLLGYLVRYLCDFLCVIISASIVVFGSTFYNTETLLFLSVYPFLVIKIFSFANKMVHENLDNGKYFSFFIIFIFPMFAREILFILSLTTFYYLLDCLLLIYCFILLFIIANKESIYRFIQLVRRYRTEKIKTQTLFQELKDTKFSYIDLLQTYIFLNTIIQNWILAYISGLSLYLQIVYLIIELSPLILYGLCIFSHHSAEQQYPQKYSPSFMNILLIILSISYSIVSYVIVLGQNQNVYSLAMLLNVLLFSMVVEGEKIVMVYFKHFQNIFRVFIISSFFLLIYIPFITVFVSGYYLTSFSQSYLYYYSLSGFFYIWLIITIFGVGIHLVLNLSAKSNKNLFVAKYMQNEMNNINMKQNVEKILTISDLFDTMNENSQQLLNYLKSQKTIIVAVRKQKEIPYDYEFIEPEDMIVNRKMSIHAKAINNLDLKKLMKKNPQLEEQQSQNQEIQHNPILNLFKQKKQQKLQIEKPKDYNQNLKEIKKMAQVSVRTIEDCRIIEKNDFFKDFQKAKAQEISITMGKMFNFLSQPSENISQETFYYFVQMLTKQRNKREQTNNLYNKFCQSVLMNEPTFKKFIIDFIQYTFDMKEAVLNDKLRTFCCRIITPLLMKSEVLKYYLKRKHILIDSKKEEIWLHGIEHVQNIEQIVKFRHKELIKKAKLLRKDQKTNKKKLSEDFDDDVFQPQQTLAKQQIFNKVGKKRKVSFKNNEKKEQKEKKLLKAENVYAILVNALTECYHYYAKEKQNFGLTSISFRLSNILAIVTKITDIVFVFGYSTIYVLIAYFYQSYESPANMLSSVSYNVLVIGSSVSVFFYILMMIYHKEDFEKGTLGLDQFQRSLGLKNFKFYTTNLIFLFGSGLANYVLSIALNSFICNQQTKSLFNFTSVECYNKLQYSYMLVGLLILVIYWPLSAITFPFSTAMNRDLEIKYKAQFEIVYLQIKFLINGYNNLLNPFSYKTEQLINSILKIITCSVLAILFLKTRPCSFKIMDVIEGKIYIMLSILSFAGALCYFVGFTYSLIITGCLMGLYLIYFIYYTVVNFKIKHNEQQQNEILQNKVKNQKMKIDVFRHNEKETIIKLSGEHQSKKTHLAIFKTEDRVSDNIPEATFINLNERNKENNTEKIFNFKSIFFM